MHIISNYYYSQIIGLSNLLVANPMNYWQPDGEQCIIDIMISMNNHNNNDNNNDNR